jgi:hypothetical protein
MRKLVESVRRALSNPILSRFRTPQKAADVEKAAITPPQPISSGEKSEEPSTKHPNTSPERPAIDFSLLGPPNLQLGLSSDQFETKMIKKRHEIFAAAVVAVILQVGLLAIVTITVYGERIRLTLSFDPEKYGYPCYIGGSILLCIGISLCSIAIERNTSEFDWRIIPKPDGKEDKQAGSDRDTDNPQGECPNREYPRLLWLQKSQEVNDQSFGGYAILAGAKRHIITSSRFEDTEQLLIRDKSPNQEPSAIPKNGVATPAGQKTDASTKDETSSSTAPEHVSTHSTHHEISVPQLTRLRMTSRLILNGRNC